MRKTNYLEAVGLILVGFGLYETIYTKARVTPLAAEWGLTATFDQSRIFAIVINCFVVALSLVMIQYHRAVELEKPESPAHAYQILVKSLWDWREKMAPLAFGLQFFVVATVAGLFSAQAACAFFIGFIFIDVANFVEKKGWLST